MAHVLVDESIGRDLVVALVAQGFVTYHRLDIGPKHAHDSLIFFEAQKRGLTNFTLNRKDFVCAAMCWENWGIGDHRGVITPREGPQPSPPTLLRALQRLCADASSFVNRIEIF